MTTLTGLTTLTITVGRRGQYEQGGHFEGWGGYGANAQTVSFLRLWISGQPDATMTTMTTMTAMTAMTTLTRDVSRQAA